MSQSGRYATAAPAGTYVQTVTGNSGGAVSPTSGGNVNVVGSGVVTVTGNPGTHTLTTSVSNGTDGQLLIGGGTAPAWANLTSAGGSVAITNSANAINLEAVGGGGGTTAFATDSGTAHEAGGSITIAGGANIDTSGAGHTVTVGVHPNLTAISSVTTTNGGALRTGVALGNTMLLQAYDTNGFVYTTLATLTAGNIPAMDLANAVTIGGHYIYREAGTDVAITDGGTGLSTTPTDGQLLIGKTATNAYVLTTLTAGTAITISNGSGSITIGAAATVPISFPTDSGTATPALNALTVAGGTNIGTTGAGATVTVNLDSALTGIASITTSTGGSLQTGTTAADTTLLRAYDNTGASYTTFATLTAGLTPTFDLSDATTKAGNYIYRAGGTDVAITDGGTGLSTTPTDGQLLVGKTATNAYVITTLTEGTGIDVSNGSGSITIGVEASIPNSFATDSGTATPALNSLTVAGGTNIGTTGAGSTVTVNLDSALTGISSITTSTGGSLQTGTTAADTTLLKAYDNTGASYTTFATLTAGLTPTFDLADATTKAGNYIYRAGGTDVAIADGGTGLSTTPTDGQLLVGKTATNAYVQTTLTEGTGIDISNGSGSITIGVEASIPSSFATDSGTATPALNSITVAGGTNIGTTGAGSTVTVNLDSALTGISSITTSTGGSLQTGTTAADTALLKAYDNTGASYTTFATLTAGLTPTFDLADATTKAGNYIYRAGGTDVAIADGGTGLSTTPTDGQLLIGKTATNAYVQATLTEGTGIDISNGSGAITVGVEASIPNSFATDSGTATPALNSLTVAGGTNIGSTGAGSTVTLNLDADITGMTSVVAANGGAFETDTTAGHTALLRAYDNTGASYTTFATLTAGLTPTMDLADSVTKASSYIYRAGGTDVAIADGGTGLSTTPTDGQLLIGKTATNNYSLATLTAGSNVSITNGSGTITIAASGAAPWNVINSGSGGSATMVTNNNYLVTVNSYTLNLPATSSVGDMITVLYTGSNTDQNFIIGQAAGQSIRFGDVITTTGVSGYVANHTRGDCVTMVCSTANTAWVVTSGVGNWYYQ